MNIFEFDGKSPQIHPDAWVAPTATLIGDVRLGPDASVWYGAVLRADIGPIIVGEGSNVQDNSVLHVRPGSSLEMGPNSTIAHGCVMHGDRIGAGSLIGNGAVVSDGVVIGDGCLVAAGAMVVEGTEIPDHSLVMGVPAKVRGTIEPGSNPAAILELNAPGYVEFMKQHRATVRPV
ncbi:MAG: gamma carbonic anhydrase family protein [Nocardioides sp.]|uniref:gamma carbonic anhydrase family protein n=1 Tax=Nocardioides sp. TaxID=35761 RepID=UPI003D6A7549